jgi:hypothetical protein
VDPSPLSAVSELLSGSLSSFGDEPSLFSAQTVSPAPTISFSPKRARSVSPTPSMSHVPDPEDPARDAYPQQSPGPTAAGAGEADDRPELRSPFQSATPVVAPAPRRVFQYDLPAHPPRTPYNPYRHTTRAPPPDPTDHGYGYMQPPFQHQQPQYTQHPPFYQQQPAFYGGQYYPANPHGPAPPPGYVPPPPPPPPPVQQQQQQPLDAQSIARIVATAFAMQNQNAPPAQQTQNTPRFFVPPITIVANRSAFYNTKHWEKANTKLSRRAGNFHVWKDELIRSLSNVALLDRYIDHSPLLPGSYLPPPTLSFPPSYAEEQNLHNYNENDANVRKLMRMGHILSNKSIWCQVQASVDI